MSVLIAHYEDRGGSASEEALHHFKQVRQCRLPEPVCALSEPQATQYWLMHCEISIGITYATSEAMITGNPAL